MRSNLLYKLPIFAKPIDEIDIPSGRDAIYLLLRGIQEMYSKEREITTLIMDDLTSKGKRSSSRGAKGMTAWQIFILSVLRMNLGRTFDELEFDFNHNDLIRKFLQLGALDSDTFKARTLNDNFRHLSPETLNSINALIVEKAVHEGFEDGKVVRGDIFVCDTNVHYPTDQSLLGDGCRKVISICSNYKGWRQHKYLLKLNRRLVRTVAKAKRGRDSANREKKAYKKLLEFVEKILRKGLATFENDVMPKRESEHLVYFLSGLEYVRGLAYRRTQRKEKIEHSEKLFSLFEPHTEMINRGKFPQPYQLGHRVLFVQGRSGMILKCKVMDNGSQDVDELLPALKELSEKYGKLKDASFDKGYWSPENKKKSSDFVENLIVARKGNGTKASKEEERTNEFIKARIWRSGVEALISVCVRSNGLDRCRDKGKSSFETWVQAASVTRNLIQLGALIAAREKENQNLNISA